jgi:L-alanine-DL-glutamate epimerase-like enolase superfamily enzyme
VKVESSRVRVVEVPTGRGPLGEIPFRLGAFLAIEVRTEDAAVGIAACGYVHPATIGALRAAAEAVLDAAVGMDIWDTRRLERLRDAMGNASPAGLIGRAFSALDVALWDLRGKAAGQPVWRLLGASGPKVACYASGHLWRHYSLAELEQSAGELAAMGFRAMKLRCGGEPRAAAEIERLAVVRRAVGDDVELMVDINQGWTVAEAVRIGRRFAEHDLFWLEDPTHCEDFAGHAAIAAALDTPVCAGEYVYGLAPLRQLLIGGAVDILMPDCLRAGGITGFMKAAHLAEAHNRPVASHLATEFLAHAIAACANGLTVEHMPWTFPLFTEVPSIDPADGKLVLFDRPGFGLSFDEGALARLAAG